MVKSKRMARKVENATDCIALLNNAKVFFYNVETHHNISCYGDYTTYFVSRDGRILLKADSVKNLFKQLCNLCYQKNLINLFGYALI